MKVPSSEIAAIRRVLYDGGPEPSYPETDYRYFCERLLEALDDITERLEPLREYL